MKALLTVLAGAALLASPMAASAHGFGGGGRGGFAGRSVERPIGRGVGFRGPVFRGVGYRWGAGVFLPALYWDAYLADPFDYGLAPAPIGCHWVEVDGQALLIQDATGAVIQAAPL